ncbi:MFS transporter [Pelagibacterium montanilacus]|uniref:MFS transporter n=1 Tax=Pelagibacterium montanilacus TaxID=2185280 RepID=UPI000F8C3993|nr:MFS transporter [Pelagibacterium montanilacus]
MTPARYSISALFLANGFLIGSWAPKIPVMMDRLAITESVMGMLIVAFGVGSVVMMPVFGGITARHGSRMVVRFASIAVIPTLLAVTLAPSLSIAAFTVFLFGGIIGGMDVAMNANAVAVERKLGKAIMSSCHGFWSIGGLMGAALAGALLGQWGETVHAVALTAVTGLVIVLALPGVLDDSEPQSMAKRAPLALPRVPLPYLIGIMALFSMVPEGTILDWSAHYLRTSLGTDISVAALGFAAFSATMATMRFVGDAVRQRLGAVRTLRISTGIALAGLLVGGLAQTPAMAIAGFALAGVGIANLVPIAFSAAGNLPGIPSGIGLSIATVTGYCGLLLAPGIIGFVGEWTGFRPVFLGVAALLVVPFVLSPLARYAEFASDR